MPPATHPVQAADARTHPVPGARLKGPPFYRFEARLEPTPIGIVPGGLRLAVAFEGQVTGGELAACGFAGARVWGIDHLLLRPDGVGIIDAPKTLSAGGRHLYEHVQGYCLPPEGMEMPPLEALLEPGFQWPDLFFPVLASCRWQAPEPELAHLNRALGSIEGWANFATGGLAIQTRLVEPSGAVPVPGRAPLAS